MSVFTFMIMNVGAVMYVCDRCCGQNASNIQLFPSSWSMRKAGIISDVFVAAEQGLESALPLDTSSRLIRKYSEESAASLTVNLPSLHKGQSYTFCEGVLKKSKEIKERGEREREQTLESSSLHPVTSAIQR